jgi:hypothetical protein
MIIMLVYKSFIKTDKNDYSKKTQQKKITFIISRFEQAFARICLTNCF